MINCMIVDDPVRVDWDTVSCYYYGKIIGFSDDRYKISMSEPHSLSKNEKNIHYQYCKEPDRIEVLLYF